MSNSLLQEYKDYYGARAKRFEGNPNYQYSFQAESQLSQAMQSCGQLEEFKGKIGNLNELCAVALVKDEHLLEQAHFHKHQEWVRRLIADQVLARADGCTNVSDLITMVQEVSQQVSIEISVDEANREFQSAWDQLDDAEICANAEVPNEYKAEFQQSAQETRAEVAKSVVELEQELHKLKPNWRMTPEVVTEHRHRRLLPYSDQHIQERLSEYRAIVGR